jgi:calcineurin-like phosphoesterase family protein
MDETLIKNWNSRVKPEDTVFHLGDFAFKLSKNEIKNILDRLNGQIILVAGNHDSSNNMKSIIKDMRIYYGGKDILLTHRAEEAGPGYYLVLCGHAHDLWRYTTIKFYEFSYDCCNVGVDQWNFFPITINEILKEYGKWKKDKKK